MVVCGYATIDAWLVANAGLMFVWLRATCHPCICQCDFMFASIGRDRIGYLQSDLTGYDCGVCCASGLVVMYTAWISLVASHQGQYHFEDSKGMSIGSVALRRPSLWYYQHNSCA